MDELQQIQPQIQELQKKAEYIANQKKSSAIEDMRSKIKALVEADIAYLNYTKPTPQVVAPTAQTLVISQT